MAIAFIESQVVSSNVAGTGLTLPSTAGGTNILYVIAAGRKGANSGVTGITGGSLTWTERTPATDPCSARDQTGLALWTAFGSPVAFAAVITYGVSTAERSAAILSYSGAAETIDDPSSENTLGDPASTCAGGTDNTGANLDVTTAVATETIVMAIMTKNTTITTKDADYTQRAFTETVGAQNELYVHDRIGAPTGLDNCAHTLSGASDWVMCGLAFREAATAGLPPRRRQPKVARRTPARATYA